jgi:O-methyltransferase
VSAVADDLIGQLTAAAVRGSCSRIALLGYNGDAIEVHDILKSRGWQERLLGIFDPAQTEGRVNGLRPWPELATANADLLFVCEDAEKEELLRAYVQLAGDVRPLPLVVLSGMAHLNYRSDVFNELDRPAMVPSYATGHPHTRIHLFQCLEAAAAAGLSGAVVELGAFKGGTTGWLARVVKRLGLNSRVIGFDSWAGFPSRQSVLDLYTHPRCVFTDLASVRR